MHLHTDAPNLFSIVYLLEAVHIFSSHLAHTQRAQDSAMGSQDCVLPVARLLASGGQHLTLASLLLDAGRRPTLDHIPDRAQTG